MTRLPMLSLCAVAVCITPGASLGQPPPDRNANVYDGTAHEPAPGPTTDRERSAGVLPSDARQRQENSEVDALGRKLLGSERSGPGDGTADNGH